MKTLIFTLTSAWMLCNASIKAQITLDFTVPQTVYGYYFYPAQISDNETKYIFVDTASNTFSLYNLDFTPFITNISPPDSIHSRGLFYHIMYITRSLFDCDSTNIEYMFSAQSSPFNPLWIVRTDGTILFRADSSRGPYCLGCPGGTSLLRPILNTEDGTKLVIMKDTFNTGQGLDVSIYSLCGNLPNGVEKYDFSSLHPSYVKIFPNPSQMQLSFELTLPDNINDYDLIIINSVSQEIKKEKVGSLRNEFLLDVRNYSSGTYFYSLESQNNILQTGKFILAK